MTAPELFLAVFVTSVIAGLPVALSLAALALVILTLRKVAR